MRTFVILLALANTAQAQQAYPTPEAATSALVDAIERQDRAATKVVLGDDYREVLSIDQIARADVDTFVGEYRRGHELRSAGTDRMVIAVANGWTFPIPLVRGPQGWSFDTRAGAAEMRTRRIGRDELAAVRALRGAWDAQKEYARADHAGDGIPQYAQQLVSHPGRRDGLYWPTASGEPESPLGPFFARAPYEGYRFRILSSQGANAPGGARDYVVDGRMTNGFAIIAWPARYGDTGVMTFLISHDGVVYQKDLGPKTDAIAPTIERFDPDPSWTALR